LLEGPWHKRWGFFFFAGISDRCRKVAATRPTTNGTRGKTGTNPLIPSNLKYKWVVRSYSRVRLCSPGPIMPDEPGLSKAARCAPAAMGSKRPLTPSSASNVPLEMPK